MSKSITYEDLAFLYAGFQSPLSALDCGDKCAPYNERSVPFCCDTRHAVPTAFQAEWEYLKVQTDLWHLVGEQTPTIPPKDVARLKAELPSGQVLVECQGDTLCQRSYRVLTCRAFPFFPYIQSNGEFIGLSYYWEYRHRCWIISNLHMVTPDYLAQFVLTYERLFEKMPQEQENFAHHAEEVRRSFARQKRRITLLHRDGFFCKINPANEELQRISGNRLPKFGVYKIAARLKFPDDH